MKILAAGLLLTMTACGPGNVIVNIDVLSFLPAGDSTQHYDVPGAVAAGNLTVSSHFVLPAGLDNSVVDSISGSLASQLENAAGGGQLTLQVFFSPSWETLYTGTPYLTNASGHVSGRATMPMGSNSMWLEDSIFKSDSLWVGIRARLATDSGPNMTGDLRLTDLHLRIVIQDKIL
jgi:hypothetical protein